MTVTYPRSDVNDMATSETGRKSDDKDSTRTLLGFVTVSDNEENGFRVALPKNTAVDEGFQSGDTLRVEHDPVNDEFILPYVE